MTAAGSQCRLSCPEDAAANYPIQQLIPKYVTQADLFLKENPTYDGRGVVIAVLDTGVDPSIEDLRVTSDGKQKIIDCIDASGSGDVDTSTVKKVETDGCVVGLTGRRLKIPESWSNPTGSYHVGIKNIYGLYASTLAERIKNEKRSSQTNSDISLAVADVLRQINAHETEIGGTSEKLSDKFARENLNYQLEFLRSFEKSPDPGPIADCLVWHDGDKWVACIDTSFRGRLNLCKVLTNFRDNYEFGFLTDNDRLAYTVTIHNQGNLLEIYTPCHSHASHVACIAAAYDQKNPENNGIAPGAQIVSIKIGDTRLDMTETGTALSRAFNRCVELGVDVGNMSYGESTCALTVLCLGDFVGSGQTIDWLRKMVDKHHFLFVTSASNSGPALSTIGTPAGDVDGVFSIGAYIPQQSTGILYGARNQCEENLFAFSSRGPTPNGSLGLTVCAPGTAIAGVCAYELNSKSLMNGTSMSSPNAAGNIACLLSAFKQLSIPISPYRVKLAIENSALLPKTSDYKKLDIGQGILQLKEAFELSKHLTSIPATLNGFDLSVTDSSTNEVEFSKAGIYLRESYLTEKLQDFVVNVKPTFREESENNFKIGFERKIALVSNAPYIHHTNFLFVSNKTAPFQLRVDPTGLEKGKVHFTEVVGFDTENHALGPLFRLPITIIVPEEISSSSNYKLTRTLEMKAAEVSRLFFKAPVTATYGRIKFKTQNPNVSVKIFSHLTGLLPGQKYTKEGNSKMITLNPGKEEIGYKKFVGGRTYELASTLNFAYTDSDVEKIDLEIEFFGAFAEEPKWNSNQQAHPLRVWSKLKFEEIQPAVTFRGVAQTVRAESAKLYPLGPRDIYDNGIQINNLVLTYKFTVPKSAEYTLHFPELSNYLYESPIDVLTNVYQDGKFVLTTGPYPERWKKTLEKGNYRVVSQLRHKDEKLLEKFKDLPLEVRWKLGNAISLNCYREHEEALSDEGSKVTKLNMRAGKNVQCFFAPISEDKLPKGLKSGDYLLGAYTVVGNEDAKKVVQYPLTYPLNEIGTKRIGKLLSTVVIEPKKDEKKDPQVEFAEKVRDLKISLLSTLKDDKFATEVFNQLEKDNPDHLPLLLAQLKRLSENKSNYQQVLDLSQKIVELAKPEEVLQHLGARENGSQENLLKKEELNKRKETILKALEIKANTIVDAYLHQTKAKIPSTFRSGLQFTIEDPSVPPSRESTPASNDKQTDEGIAVEAAPVDTVKAEESEESLPEPAETVQNTIYANFQKEIALKDVDDAFRSLMIYADPNNYEILILASKHAVAHDYLGIALRCINKAIEEKSTNRLLFKARYELAEALGWNFVENQFKNDFLSRFSMGDSLF
ncbi:Tripeptidyl-peptidase 2 [Aphelenchoides bicaudatus]|nr:Tripeptidyl-peptidase 2 [Aphelenchoides bicaudatus]